MFAERSIVSTTAQKPPLSVCCFMQISWWRLRSLVDSKKSHGNKETLTFPGDRNHALVPGLTPFSEYSLIVMTFNGRGNGPGSHPVNFKTPEGGRNVGKQHGVYWFYNEREHLIIAMVTGFLLLISPSYPHTVPEKNPVFRVTDVQRHTVSVSWAPPLEPNGALTGYLLEYQLSTYLYIMCFYLYGIWSLDV